MDLTITPGLPNVQWTFNTDSTGFAHVIPVTVHNAIDPTTIPSGYQPHVAHLTRQDWDAILSLDPYVDVATRTIRSSIPVVGSARFAPTGISMPLDGRVGSDFKTVDSSTVKSGSSSQVSITEGFSSSVGVKGFLTLFRTSSSLSFTYATSDTASWTTSQSAEVSLKTSSTTFAGDYDVYFDRVFGTFLLVDAPVSPIRASGIVRDSSGHPLVDKKVTITLPDGSKRITYTDGDGRYRFRDLPEGAVAVEAQGKHWSGFIDHELPTQVDF